MQVHAAAVIADQWLRHKRCGLTVGVRDVKDAVFVDLHLVSFLGQRVERDADLALARSTDLMVMQVDGQTHGLHGRAHRVSNVVQRVHWWYGEVAAFDARLMAQVAAFRVVGCHPRRFFRLDLIHGAAHVGFVLDIVENEKFWFRAEIGCVTDTGSGQVRLSSLGERAWIAVVALHGAWLEDVAADVNGGFFSERIDHRGAVVRHQDHVGFVNRLPATDG